MPASSTSSRLTDYQKHLIHFAALHALEHAERHGDITPLYRLADLFPKDIQFRFAKWLSVFSPVSLTAERDKLKIKLWKKSSPKYRPYDLDSAGAYPFLAFTGKSPAQARENLFKERDVGAQLATIGIWFGKTVSIAGQVSALPLLPMDTLFALYRKCIERIALGVRGADAKLRDAIVAEWANRAVLSASDEYFDWPSTEAIIGFERLGRLNSPEHGMLSAFGYHVGKNGVPENLRRVILDDIFSIQLPPLNSAEYLDEWKQPSTPGRLKKLAHTLAALAVNEKGRGLVSAPEQREADLDYLYSKYYVGKFRFKWPDLDSLQ